MSVAQRRRARWHSSGGLALLLLLNGCDRAPPQSIALEGRPGGPQRLTLTIAPATPTPSDTATLTYQMTESASGAPVQHLQITHERVLHTFIVARDFSTFAHIHHEDFQTLTAADLAAARFHFPYRFPHPGRYRIVTEYVYRDRSWLKQFDFTVGAQTPAAPLHIDLSRTRSVGAYTAALTVSPNPPIAGHAAELVLHLTRQGAPVANLQLLLGAETHVAIWRSDGEEFGHTHSYTPEMATLMEHMRGMAHDPAEMSAMMMTMMPTKPKLVYPGPDIPVRYQFPTPGLYQVFMQTAPGGATTVFGFMLEVQADAAGVNTQMHSIVPIALDSPR